MTRFIFSIERHCPKSPFLARDAAIPSVSPLGCVSVLFLASEVDELWSSITYDARVGWTQMTSHTIDLNVRSRAVLFA